MRNDYKKLAIAMYPSSIALETAWVRLETLNVRNRLDT